MRSAVTVQWHKINNARGRSAAGFCGFSRVEHVEHVERFWKQLEQLVKTTSTPRNKRGDSRAPAEHRNTQSKKILIYYCQSRGDLRYACH